MNQSIILTVIIATVLMMILPFAYAVYAWVNNKLDSGLYDHWTETSFVVRPRKIHLVIGIFYSLVFFGMTLFIYWMAKDNLTKVAFGIIIFLSVLIIPGLLMILSTIPGFNDIYVDNELITVSQFFVKKRLNVSDIIYYKYNPNLKTYRVYVNGKRKWSFGFDNSNYNAMPFIEMLRVYGVKNADENLSLYDISDRRMAKYNRHFLVVIMFEIIAGLFFGFSHFSEWNYHRITEIIITVYASISFFVLPFYAFFMTVYCMSGLDAWSQIDYEHEVVRKNQVITIIMAVVCAIMLFVIIGIAKDHGVKNFVMYDL